MKPTKAFDVAIVALCAALYAVVGYLTSFNLTFGGVAFWPAAFVPAIFAVLFGKWAGGFGAAIGIFIRDVIVIGQPLLSLTAGVTSNFVMFFLIGYFSRTQLSRKKLSLGLVVGAVVIFAGILLPTLFLPAESLVYTQFLSTETIVILFSAIMVVTLVLFALIAKYWKEFRSFGVGAIIGQATGAMVVAIGVWAYSQLFYSAGGYFTAPLSAAFASLIFVWTFATEIPFVLLISPPVVKACYSAFPFLRRQTNLEQAT